jgi:hypothetical protein
VSFAAITLCVASQRVFIVVVVVYIIMTKSGNFLTHPRIARLGKKSNVHKILIGKIKWKRQFGRWGSYIKMDLKEIVRVVAD